MANCNKCGKEVKDGETLCLACRANDTANDFVKKVVALNDTPDTTADYDAADIEKNKWMALLSYLGLLFLIPLFLAKDSRFARFHVNQGITLAIAGLLTSLVATVFLFIPIIGLVFGILFYIVDLAFLALTIIGIINVVQGRAKELPVIGKYTLLK